MWLTLVFLEISILAFYMKTTCSTESFSDKEQVNDQGFRRRLDDAEIAKRKAEIVRKAKSYDKHLALLIDQDFENERFQRDPMLDFMSRRSRVKRRTKSSDSSDTASSSLEMKNWKDEWKEHWLQKKLEAINSSVPKGDIVNMVAASKTVNIIF